MNTTTTTTANPTKAELLSTLNDSYVLLTKELAEKKEEELHLSYERYEKKGYSNKNAANFNIWAEHQNEINNKFNSDCDKIFETLSYIATLL